MAGYKGKKWNKKENRGIKITIDLNMDDIIRLTKAIMTENENKMEKMKKIQTRY